LGFIYIYKKDYVKGITLIRKAVQLSKSSPIDYRHLLCRLGFAYLYMGDYDQAENYFTQTRNLGGRYLSLCHWCYYQGNFKKALECALNCYREQPEIWNDYFLGNTCFQLGDYLNAVTHYRKFRENREALGLNQWDNLYREGIALQHLGYMSEGSDLIQQRLILLEKRKKLDRPDG
jgi:tetratricopeptide (TPR) repeat protein